MERKEREPSLGEALCHIQTAVSLILVQEKKKEMEGVYDSDLNVNGFPEGPSAGNNFCQLHVYIQSILFFSLDFKGKV